MTESETTMNVVLPALYGVLKEMNQERPEDEQLVADPETKLYGKGGSLDSLDLVRLVVFLEQAIGEATNTSVSLSDERAMSQSNSNFKTVGSLAAFVVKLIEEDAASA
ncbi:MAG: acyl carrier protein [Deltaproteobacteria bacterium]|nr:acyl carrier protein [Deltaproteobacteria bacterium]